MRLTTPLRLHSSTIINTNFYLEIDLRKNGPFALSFSTNKAPAAKLFGSTHSFIYQRLGGACVQRLTGPYRFRRAGAAPSSSLELHLKPFGLNAPPVAGLLRSA